MLMRLEATPLTPKGLTDTDVLRIGQSLDSSVSNWRSFEHWTQAHGNLSLPASPPLAAAYLSHLAQEHHRSGHRPAPPSCPGRRPQGPWPTEADRQCGRQDNDREDRAGPAPQNRETW